MITVKPFRGVRPPQQFVIDIVSRPYDVLSSAEAFDESKGNEKSLYHIIKPEIDFWPIIDEHDERVYAKGVENYALFKDKGWLIKDQQPCYYLYAQQMGDHKQYGFVLTASVDDYLEGRIKKHELTRIDKEQDRMRHVRETSANIEPVFLAFKHNDVLEDIITLVSESNAPTYAFTSADGIGHEFWVIDSDVFIDDITYEFSEMEAMYIADGHHRSAAAAKVGEEMRKSNPGSSGEEEYNYFMAVCFPENQLKIMDYNRLVKDLNGYSSEEFLSRMKDYFEILLESKDYLYPSKLHQFSIYIDGKWILFEAKKESCGNDIISQLDVSISSKFILDEILGIKDLRTDKRIDFVGGIRGYEELKQRVDSGEMRLAIALYPVSMQELMAVADNGQIMPPKTTWFEPKLRSGLVIHDLL